MNITKQYILDKLYAYYPVGITPIDDEYERSCQFKVLENKISDQLKNLFWNLILNQLFKLYENKIQDLTILNAVNPLIVNASNPCYILSFSPHINGEFNYEVVFYLSAIEELYCFGIKKITSQNDNEIQSLIDKNLLKLQSLDKFKKHEFFNEEIKKQVTDRDEIVWNTSFPELQKDIDTITCTIEKNSNYKLFSENYLFEIVPNIATYNKQILNTATFFNCLFGNVLE